MKSAIVALSQLIPDTQCNSRQGWDDDSMTELVKSIEANGLILPLSVRPGPDKTFLIIDGHRRFEALSRIYSTKKEEYHVPVLVRDADNKDARAMSLAANIVRLPLHPADQYKAFAEMLREGMDRAEIAARFNLALKDVERVLALGGVIPAALQHYRDGKIDADTIKLFASVSEDRQMSVWKQAYEEGTLTRWQVHRLLTDNTLKGDTPVAKLVGEGAYEHAGGRIERSLFNTETRWLDVELALKLAKQAMADLKDKLLAEGWAFAMVESDMPKTWRNWSREYAEIVFTAEQLKDLSEIDARLDELHEIDAKDWTDELEEEQEKLDERAQEIRTAAQHNKAFTAEQKDRSGVVLMEDYSIIPGIVWSAKEKKPEPGDAPKKPEVKGWSQVLLDEVDSHGTVAAQLAIMREPNVADCMMLAGMYQDTVHDVTARVMAFNSADKFSDVQINAGAEIQKALKSFGIKGAEFWRVFEQVRALSLPQREQLRAVLVARAMRKRRGAELETLLDHLTTTDLAATWVPGKEFFERLNTAQLSEIHKELTGFGLAEPTLKKSAVEIVAKKAEAANWVPKWLRKGQAPGKGTVLAPPKKAKKAEKGDVITTVVGEDGKTESVKRKKAA